MAPRIGVIGSSGQLSQELAAQARAVGREIALRGGILFSGGQDGVMEAASQGAQEAGGLTVGILPGSDPTCGNPYLTVRVTTGLNCEYRSLALVHTVDVLLMLCGGNGTLGELSAAYLNGKPVVVLAQSGGWSAKIRETLYDQRYLDERRTIEIRFAQRPAEAVATAFALL